MTSWKKILENEYDEISNFNFPKLNVIQQKIADLLMSEGVTIREGKYILKGMIEKEMLNRGSTRRIFKRDNDYLIKIEKCDLHD